MQIPMPLTATRLSTRQAEHPSAGRSSPRRHVPLRRQAARLGQGGQFVIADIVAVEQSRHGDGGTPVV
jgi:hypothetical protein